MHLNDLRKKKEKQLKQNAFKYLGNIFSDFLMYFDQSAIYALYI